MHPATPALILAAAINLAACTAPTPPPAAPPEEQEPPPPPPWPEPGSVLRMVEVELPEPLQQPRRIFLDPGHGSRGNPGNTSCLCIQEQDHNLRVAQHLAEVLEATGAFEVRLSRQEGAVVDYPARLSAARAWHAELLLSLHSDARGQGLRWEDTGCHYNDLDPGFSVLWSDEGDQELTAARHELARALAGRFVEAGFAPYPGGVYEGLYEVDPAQTGVFVDRHRPRRRIMMLRRPAMPSVIIETHNAWDRREERRWQERLTLDSFASTALAKLADLDARRSQEPGEAS